MNSMLKGGVHAMALLTLPALATVGLTANPLIEPWTGPYGGVPPFDRVQVDHFAPAFEASMALYRQELQVITDNPEPPSFENTIAAFERAGRTYGRVRAVYGVWSSSLSSPEFQAVEREMAAKLAAFRDEIMQNAKLFQRIEAIYQSPDKDALTAEQQRLVWLHYTEFVRSGAKLDETQKARVSAINQRLAALFTAFSQNLLADEEQGATVLAEEAELAGLPDSLRSAATRGPAPSRS